MLPLHSFAAMSFTDFVKGVPGWMLSGCGTFVGLIGSLGILMSIIAIIVAVAGDVSTDDGERSENGTFTARLLISSILMLFLGYGMTFLSRHLF